MQNTSIGDKEQQWNYCFLLFQKRRLSIYEFSPQYKTFLPDPYVKVENLKS